MMSRLLIFFLLTLTSTFELQEPTFYLYTTKSTNNPVILSMNNDTNNLKHLNHSKNFVLIIHGYKTNVNKTSWQRLKDTILKKVKLFYVYVVYFYLIL
jgi:hypothetical protein